MLGHCAITGLCPMIFGDQKLTGFLMVSNALTPGPYNYVLEFQQATAMPVNYGQVSLNSLDSINQLDLSLMTGNGIIPLGNNYWRNGLPSIRYQNGSTQNVSFDLQLIAPPTDVGPSW